MDCSSSRPLEIFFIPFLAPGHLVPLSEVASLFAARGEHVTIITTPSNAALIHQTTSSGNPIPVHVIPFPAKEVGLPDGFENQYSATDVDSAAKVFHGMNLMQPAIEHVILTRRPDCIVSDAFYPWTVELAGRLSIPRLVFEGSCIFAKAMYEAIRNPTSPHLNVKSDYEPFVILDLPHRITMTRSQLPDYLKTLSFSGFGQLRELFREADLKSYGVLVNSFSELESGYADYYTKIMGHKAFLVGPSTFTVQTHVKSERSNKSAVSQQECLSWLDSKKPDSVLYVCFGSGCKFPDAQLMEIACGLESAGPNFIWVVLGKDGDTDADMEEWLPKGFKQRIIETGRGMIVKGWAPQLLILEHPSTGGFLTHCGWNSVIEGVSGGVQMLTWPLYAEQFFNEKLVTQVLGIGVEVGSEDWCMAFFDAGKKGKVFGREKIEKGVRKLMDGGDEAKERRRKCKELGEKARRAVEGGSSHKNLTVLIEELKKLRDEKTS